MSQKSLNEWLETLPSGQRNYIKMTSASSLLKEFAVWLEKKAAQQSMKAYIDRRCPKCNSLLEDTSVYCDNCGTDTPRR